MSPPWIVSEDLLRLARGQNLLREPAQGAAGTSAAQAETRPRRVQPGAAADGPALRCRLLKIQSPAFTNNSHDIS